MNEQGTYPESFVFVCHFHYIEGPNRVLLNLERQSRVLFRRTF